MNKAPTTLEMDGITEGDLPFILMLQCRLCGEWTGYEKDKEKPAVCIHCSGPLDSSSIKSKRSVVKDPRI